MVKFDPLDKLLYHLYGVTDSRAIEAAHLFCRPPRGDKLVIRFDSDITPDKPSDPAPSEPRGVVGSRVYIYIYSQPGSPGWPGFNRP